MTPAPAAAAAACPIDELSICQEIYTLSMTAIKRRIRSKIR
jgi:hypothetical protein